MKSSSSEESSTDSLKSIRPVAPVKFSKLKAKILWIYWIKHELYELLRVFFMRFLCIRIVILVVVFCIWVLTVFTLTWFIFIFKWLNTEMFNSIKIELMVLWLKQISPHKLVKISVIDCSNFRIIIVINKTILFRFSGTFFYHHRHPIAHNCVTPIPFSFTNKIIYFYISFWFIFIQVWESICNLEKKNSLIIIHQNQLK